MIIIWQHYLARVIWSGNLLPLKRIKIAKLLLVSSGEQSSFEIT